MTPFLFGTPKMDEIRGLFAEKGVKLVEFYEVKPNPRYTDMDMGVRKCIEEQCDVVISIGGGSAIDSEKP